MTLAIALILALQDPPETVRRLIDDVRSEKADVREEARRRLKELGRRAAPALEKAAKDPDPEVAASAQSLLRVLAIADQLPAKLKKAVPGLEDRLAVDKHAWTVAFLELLKNLSNTDLETEDLECLAAPALQGAVDTAERQAIVENLEGTQFRSTIPELLKLLGDPELRREAAWVLADWDVREAVPPLLGMLEDEDPQISVSAIYCLERLHATEAIPAIRKLLKDEDSFAVGRAALSLGILGDRPSAPDILQLLHHAEQHVRQDAARSLAFLGEESAIPDLLQSLKDKDPQTRGMAVMALGILKAQRAAPDLIVCLKDLDAGVRVWACSSVASLNLKDGLPALSDLLRDPDPQVRRAALSGLEQMRATGTISQVIPLLQDKDDNVRCQAARTLCGLGSLEGVPTVLAGQGTVIHLSLLNDLRTPRRTQELRKQVLSGNLVGTVGEMIRKVSEAGRCPVELPEMDRDGLSATVAIPRDGGIATVLDAWEHLGRKLPTRTVCDAIVEEDRLRIVPREQALAFWTAWHLEQKKNGK